MRHGPSVWYVFTRPTCSERLTKFQVLVSDDGQSWTIAHTHGVTTNKDTRIDVSLQDTTARYVRIAASVADVDASG